MLAAILGDVDDTVPDGIGWGPNDSDGPVDLGHALRRPGDAKQGLHEFRPARPDQPIKAKDLAAPQGKADICKFGWMVIADNLKHFVAKMAFALRKDLGHIAADHHLDQFGLCHVRDHPVSHELPVAENGVAVGDAKDFVELVADEQDRLALRLQRFDQFIKLLDFLVRQGCRGFVHNDDARVNRQGASNGDKVFVGDAQIAQPVGRVDFRADAGQDFCRPPLHRLPVDQAKLSAWGVSQKDVLRHGQFIEQDRFLMDRSNPSVGRVLCRGKSCGRAIHKDFTAVRLIDAGQRLHHGGLAGTVFPDEGRDLSGKEAKRYPVQRLDPRKGLGDPVERKNGGRLGDGFCLDLHEHVGNLFGDSGAQMHAGVEEQEVRRSED